MLDMKRCRWHVDDRPENVYVYSNNCLVCLNGKRKDQNRRTVER